MEHPRIYAGVDTHSDTHTLALIDEYGRPLATQTFTADPTGYERLVAMIGDPDACLGVGVEGTNSYGAVPARRLVEAGYDVHEVLRPKRSVRRRDGKSDPVDALAAARSVLAGDGTSVPKSTDGWVEALRTLNAERGAAGHGDGRAVRLREGPAGHRPGTHPGTLPRAAHPDQDAQARRMPSQREHGGAGHARCAEGRGQGMEGPQGAGGPAGEEHETHPGGARPPAA